MYIMKFGVNKPENRPKPKNVEKPKVDTTTEKLEKYIRECIDSKLEELDKAYKNIDSVISQKNDECCYGSCDCDSSYGSCGYDEDCEDNDFDYIEGVQDAMCLENMLNVCNVEETGENIKVCGTIDFLGERATLCKEYEVSEYIVTSIRCFVNYNGQISVMFIVKERD